MELRIKEITHLLKGELKGDGEAKINTIGKIQEAQKGAIAFLSNMKYEEFIYTTKASAVIVNKDFVPTKEITASLICVDDAYSSFALLLEEYEKMLLFQKIGIEQPSFIDPTAKTGKDNYIGAFAYIGKNVTIGDNTKIYPHVYIGDNVTIGDNTMLFSGVKIYAACKIGSQTTIHSGVVVGGDGFGFAPQKDGSYKRVPQIGNVVIGDNVDIGANTAIDCGTMGSTVIEDGVKLDNLIQIAHNVTVGKNTVIAGHTGISGSVEIGENCVIAGQVGIVGHIKIANKTKIGAQSGILKEITEEGTVLLGSPAIPVKDHLRSFSVFKKLPDLKSRVDKLEKKLNQ